MHPIPLSQVDALFANGSYPIEVLFFYPEELDTAAVRAGLKARAEPFFPLFSRYEEGMIVPREYDEERFCGEESSDEPFDPAAPPEELTRMFGVRNPAGPKTLFYLQVINYPNGTVLIPKMNRLAGDGYSYFYFLATLAVFVKRCTSLIMRFLVKHIARGKHCLAVLGDFRFSGTPPGPSEESPGLTITLEKVSRDAVEQVRAETEKAGVHCSANDVLSAMALRKAAEFQSPKVFSAQLIAFSPVLLSLYCYVANAHRIG